MNGIRRFISILGLLVYSAIAIAEPIVIYHCGDTQPIPNPNAAYQQQTQTPQQPGVPDLSLLFPVHTPSMRPGSVPPPDNTQRLERLRRLPRPLFLVGSDELSRRWITEHRQQLTKLGATGFLVEAESSADYQRLLNVTGPELILMPSSAEQLSFGNLGPASLPGAAHPRRCDPVTNHYPLEALLRPPVEWTSATAAVSVATLAATAPGTLLMTPTVAYASAGILAVFASHRIWQGWRVVRYQRGLKRLPRYRLTSSRIPHAPEWLFLGRGFRWTPQHTQRLWEATRPYNRQYLEPSWLYMMARRLEDHWPWLQRVTAVESLWNPLRPLPPVGGMPALHGVGLLEGEQVIRLPSSERQGHVFYVGTTGVGKTRAAELAISQDIRCGYPVICLDPKGDPDLFRRMYAEAQNANRPFYFFHLGYPEHSARYNPIGRFSRITEVAIRIANQLPSQGNAEAFRQFAWLFTNVIARALVALGNRPDYRQILRYMNHIEPLLVQYFEHWLDRAGPANWRDVVTMQDQASVPGYLKNRDPRARMLVAYYREQELYDPVADGLRRAFEYEKTFFDKISVAVQPLLEKLLSGRIAELINPDYTDTDDPRPILEWQNVIRRRAVVYCGFDALTDPEIAAVVGQSMIADLVAYAGELYKHGLGPGLPKSEPVPETQIHLDEFAELVRGPEIVQALNKGRGAGLRFSVYTQTLADIEAGLGNRARAGQVTGNVTNTIVMLRVADLETAKLLTERLGKVEVNALMLVSGTHDSSTPESPVHFTSSTQERISGQTVPMLEPGHLMKLPRGQAFVLMEGGQLYKLRLPLSAVDDKALPSDLAAIAHDMARRYRRVPSGEWASFEESVDLSRLQPMTVYPEVKP